MIIILKIFGDKFDISGKNFFRANPTVIGTAHFWFKILDRKSRLGIDKRKTIIIMPAMTFKNFYQVF